MPVISHWICCGRRARNPMGTLGTAKAQAGDFRRTAHPKRNENFTDPTTDVDLCPVQAIPALHETLPQLRPPVERANDRQTHLSPVGVAGENQVHPTLRRDVNTQRVMAQKDLRITHRDSTQRCVQVIGFPPEIVDAGNPQGGGAGPQRVARVAENPDAMRAQGVSDFVWARLEVMISQNGEDTQPRSQLSQGFRNRPDVRARKGYVVARQGDDIGVQEIG